MTETALLAAGGNRTTIYILGGPRRLRVLFAPPSQTVSASGPAWTLRPALIPVARDGMFSTRPTIFMKNLSQIEIACVV